MERLDADIALITERRYEAPPVVTPYIQNILDDDATLIEGLRRRGLESRRVDWSRPDVDWSAFRGIVLRTPWDYFERYAEFSAWLDRVGSLTTLINPLPQVRWNIDKHYLLDLEATGVSVVPTRMIEIGEELNLWARMREAGWEAAVVKPAISGAARHTYVVREESAETVQTQLDELVGNEALLLQPFVPSIQERGEVTLMMIDGHHTHAVRKIAADGDFRVQDDHGGRVVAHEASAAERALAEAAIAACSPRPAYARVDMVQGEDGRQLLMELELIEPELWLRMCPTAGDQLADVIAKTVR